MTTPDTLASLIAKMNHEIYEGPIASADTHSEDCTRCRLEAALDALVEKWEAEAALEDSYDKNNENVTLRACAAELRGRGAGK